LPILALRSLAARVWGNLRNRAPATRTKAEPAALPLVGNRTPLILRQAVVRRHDALLLARIPGRIGQQITAPWPSPSRSFPA